MPDARRPTGPSKPTHVAREDADMREEIEDALSDLDRAAQPTADESIREQASPAARDKKPGGSRDKPSVP